MPEWMLPYLEELSHRHAFVAVVPALMVAVPLANNVLSAEQVKKVEAELVNNPPQRFDLARTLNVFNAYIEFIELRLTGMQITRHTVKLPQDLILALRDEAGAGDGQRARSQRATSAHAANRVSRG